MSTWKAAIVSAPSRTNIPAIDRNVNAMSSAAAVIRLSITTATPPAITPIESRANTTGSTKSNVTSSSAGRADRRCRRRAGSCAERREPPTLHHGDAGDEYDHEQPVRDGDRNERVGECEREGRHRDDIDQGHGDQTLPAEAHELVDSKTRKGRADPHHHHYEPIDREREPEDAEQRERIDAWSLPAAEQECRDDRADDGHVAVFGERQHRAPAHARVLGEPSGHELGLRLGEIERRAVRLRERGDEVDEE